jgi:Holliday junction resolvase-like predicted endonuclease
MAVATTPTLAAKATALQNQLGEALDMAEVYFTAKGADIMDKGWRSNSGRCFMVVKDEGALTFVNVTVSDSLSGGMPEDDTSSKERRCCEQAAMQYLSSNKVASCKLRFDTLHVAFASPGRALLRHHADALGWGG